MATTHPTGAEVAHHQSYFSEDIDGRNAAATTTAPPLSRTNSAKSLSNMLQPSKGGTLKKKSSLSRRGSLKRNGSRRSSYAGSVRSLRLAEPGAADETDEMNSAFYTPVPTSGSPTEILAERFQGWRKVLKDLVTYFREVQTSYDQRSKALLKVTNVINNTTLPNPFVSEGGINEATHILRDFHRQALAEGNKAKDMQTGVINQLTGLRADLNQKVKEIKALSGDFKNSVQKEMESTRRAVTSLQETLELAEDDPSATAGKGDPFIVRLSVERQIERQIDEENYLHRAFLNLENSGRELDSIIVGEIQKAYNAYAGILKRDADETYDAVERLRNGPIALAKDHEWNQFVLHDDRFIDPRLSLRSVDQIDYPGRHHILAAEVRAGMLERKSKYLKSYTPGWYVLTATHLHEFKSPDRLPSQLPVMSLFLPEQKLGTHSQPGSSSHKFILKGRQTGTMHRGHSWVFRAESHDTMLAWYEDLANLTNKTGAERNAFVRQHARSMSGGSQRAGSISSEGALDEDEADEVPYSAHTVAAAAEPAFDPVPAPRPSPGGRFPSDLSVDRGLKAPLSFSSDDSEREPDRTVIAAAAALPGTTVLGLGLGLESSRTPDAERPRRADQEDPASLDATVAARSSAARPGLATRGVSSQAPLLATASEPASNPAGPDDVLVSPASRPRETTVSTVSQPGTVSTVATTVDTPLEDSTPAPTMQEEAKPSTDHASIQEEPDSHFGGVTEKSAPPPDGNMAPLQRVISEGGMHVPGEFPPTPLS